MQGCFFLLTLRRPPRRGRGALETTTTNRIELIGGPSDGLVQSIPEPVRASMVYSETYARTGPNGRPAVVLEHTWRPRGGYGDRPERIAGGRFAFEYCGCRRRNPRR